MRSLSTLCLVELNFETLTTGLNWCGNMIKPGNVTRHPQRPSLAMWIVVDYSLSQGTMYNLQKKIKEQKEGNIQRQTADNKTGRISVRDRLLTQGMEKLGSSSSIKCLELLMGIAETDGHGFKHTVVQYA